MHDIRAILALEPVPLQWNGHKFHLSRPTLLDLIEAIDINTQDPKRGRQFGLFRHLHTEDGQPVFPSIEAAGGCPAGLAAKAVPMIEALYSEGAD